MTEKLDARISDYEQISRLEIAERCQNPAVLRKDGATKAKRREDKRKKGLKGLSLISMSQKCVMLWCSLCLFRS